MTKDFSKQRDWIASCDDAQKLRRFMENAEKKGIGELYDLARHRLLAILPLAECGEAGTIQYEVWRAIYALEVVRSREAGKTIRLSRTRQAIGRKGVRDTVIDFVSKPKSTEGFQMLQDRNMLEYSFEAVVLLHPDEFDPAVRDAAWNRLTEAGFDPAKLQR